MKVFIGYGYNDRDSWIPDLVVRLVRALGCEVVTGEDEQGERISDETRRRIREADGLIAFLTRRDETDANGIGRTHRWVVEELAVAIERGLKVVEVREQGVDEQGGMAGDRQRIRYEEGKRDRMLVELATTISAWTRSRPVNLQLLPEEFADDVRPLLRKPGFRCTYTFLDEGRDTEPQETPVRPIGGGLFIRPTAPSSQLLIQVCVEGNGRRWISEFVPLDSVSVPMKPEE